jgi:hypothetical protein
MSLLLLNTAVLWLISASYFQFCFGPQNPCTCKIKGQQEDGVLLGIVGVATAMTDA